MIVKNEEETLKKCLLSVADAVDEIIIVDTGSSDATKSIALDFTDMVYDYEWTNDFSAARNFSFSKASMDYILWLDADDVLLDEDAKKLKRFKENAEESFNVAMMKYNAGFDEHGDITFSFYRERLVKSGMGFKWVEPVHEYIETWGKSINTDICVTHNKPPGRRSGSNLAIYENFILNGGKLSMRGTYYYARELFDNARYTDAIVMFRSFLIGKKGWVEDNICACGKLYDCSMALNRKDEALSYLFKSFEYDTPRPEICCQIAYHFMGEREYDKAAFWFELISGLDKSKAENGFFMPDCFGYIPSIELAVCYYHLGEYEKAIRYNELAGEYKPHSEAVKANRAFFATL